METVALAAQPRSTDRTVNKLRAEGSVPCILYGNEMKNLNLQCAHKELFKAYVKAGESTIVELEIDGKKTPVLFHAIDFHPVTERILHVDFYAVNMKKEIETLVPIHCVDESPAVKDHGGVLVHTHDHVMVRCLPTNLPHALEVSIAGIKEFHDTVTVADIRKPEGVTILEEADIVLATVQEPRRAEAVEAAPAADAVAAKPDDKAAAKTE